MPENNFKQAPKTIGYGNNLKPIKGTQEEEKLRRRDNERIAKTYGPRSAPASDKKPIGEWSAPMNKNKLLRMEAGNGVSGSEPSGTNTHASKFFMRKDGSTGMR